LQNHLQTGAEMTCQQFACEMKIWGMTKERCVCNVHLDVCFFTITANGLDYQNQTWCTYTLRRKRQNMRICDKEGIVLREPEPVFGHWKEYV